VPRSLRCRALIDLYQPFDPAQAAHDVPGFEHRSGLLESFLVNGVGLRRRPAAAKARRDEVDECAADQARFPDPETLHPDDVARLLTQLQKLVDAGNTVVVVEHDMQVVTASDHVIDIGPGAGDDGGRVVASGTPFDVAGAARSKTGPFLARALADVAPERCPVRDRDTAARTARRRS
jgi:hypothetical protein